MEFVFQSQHEGLGNNTSLYKRAVSLRRKLEEIWRELLFFSGRIPWAQPARGDEPWDSQPAVLAALAHKAPSSTKPWHLQCCWHSFNRRGIIVHLCPPAWLSIEPGCSLSPREMGTPGQVCSFPSPEQGPKKQPLFASSISVWVLAQKINYSHSLT